MPSFPLASRSGCVYVASNGAGLHKIGVSNDPPKRELELRRSFGRDVRLVFATPMLMCGNLVEVTARWMLADQHVGREWFKVSRATAMRVVKVATRRVDEGHRPMDLLVRTTGKNLFPERYPAMLLKGWKERARPLYEPGENSVLFIRAAVERELERREAALTARSRTPSPRP